MNLDPFCLNEACMGALWCAKSAGEAVLELPVALTAVGS